MAWRQIATPNLTQDLIVDGGLADWLGYCLGLSETAGGTPRLYAYAWQAWENAAYKHADDNLPDGCWVPIFFYGYWNGFPYGHVAWAKKTGSHVEVWSSPYTHKPYFDIFSGDFGSVMAEICRIYGMSYFAGWTEDLAGKQFVQWESDTPEPPALRPDQRQVGKDNVNYRTGPGTSYPNIQGADGKPMLLDAGAVCDFKGYVRGEAINGNDIWYVGAYTGGYSTAEGFTASGTDGLTELTYEPPIQPPTKEGLDVVDISNYQGGTGETVRFTQLKQGGFSGVIISAGHVGVSYGGLQPYNINPYHDGWAVQAREAGLLVGHYWYCYQELDPVQEAQAFMQADIKDGEILFIDAEEQNLSEAWVNTFKQTIYNMIKATPIYYDYRSNLQAKTWVSGKVWQAEYDVGAGNYTQIRDLEVIMHQYTSTGQAPGIQDDTVDLNKFYGSAEDWRALGAWVKAPDTPPEEPPIDPLKPSLLMRIIQTILQFLSKLFKRD